MLISFILGVFAGKYLELKWQEIWPIFILAVFGILLVSLINLVLGNKILVMLGWMIILFIAGVAIYSYQNQKYFCAGDLSGENIEIEGKIINSPLLDYKSQELIIQTNRGGCQNIRLLAKIPRYPVFNIGDVISLHGNIQKPGMIDNFDYAKYLRPKMVSYLILSPQNIQSHGREYGIKNTILGTLYNFKNNFENAISRTMAEPEASLGIGIITGSKRNIPDDLNNDLSSAGLTHIIALSGFNVTIIVAALVSMLAGIFNRRKIFWIGSILVVIFIVMTGASASVVRAGIFSLLVLFGKTIGRKAYQTNLLLLAAALMLVFNPFLLADDLGFQLSFVAFAGLIYLARFVRFGIETSKLRLLPTTIKSMLGETLSAQIAVFPLIAFAFGRVSLIAPISNVLVLWLLPYCMLLAFAAGVGGICWYYLGRALSLLAWPWLAYIIAVAKYSAKLPFASLTVNKYNPAVILCLYFVIVLIGVLLNKRVANWQKNYQK